jgi:L-cysteine desulfidase
MNNTDVDEMITLNNNHTNITNLSNEQASSNEQEQLEKRDIFGLETDEIGLAVFIEFINQIGGFYKVIPIMAFAICANYLVTESTSQM